MKTFTRFLTRLIPLALMGAAHAAPTWSIRYNGPANQQDAALAMATDASGNCYLAGQTFVTTTGDMWVAKYSASGALLWSATYAGAASDDDIATEIGLDSTGNVYVAGTSGDSMAVLKYNTAGVRQWVQRFQDGATGVSSVDGMAVDPSGNVIVTGTSATSDSAPTYIVTQKYSNAGVLQWTNQHRSNATQNEAASSVKLDSLGNVVVVGSAYSPDTDYDMLVFKVSSTGSAMWEQRYDGPGFWDEGVALAIDSSNAAVVTGVSQGYWVTQKYSSAGALQWSNLEPAGSWDVSPVAIGIDGTGGIVVSGYQDLDRGAYEYDFGVVKYSPGGSKQWWRTYGDVQAPEVPKAMCVEPDGDILVVGYAAADMSLDQANTVLVKWAANGAQSDVQTFNPSGSGFANPCNVVSNFLGAITIAGSTFNEPGLSEDVFAARYVEPGQFDVVITPTSLVGGQSASGVVTLANPAPSGGVTVQLTSSNTAAARVPGSVLIPAGSSSGTFAITTTASPNDAEAVITASALGASDTAGISVLKQLLSQVSVSPSAVAGGASLTGVVTLYGPAPEGGFAVSLADSNASATVPSSVTVAAGQSSASFSITTAAVTSDVTVTVTASNSGTSVSTTFRLNRTYMNSVTLPANIAKGTTATGTVSLRFAAPTGGVVVNLVSSDPASLAVPATVTVPAGSTSKTFTVTAANVASDVAVSVTGSSNGSSASANTTVRANLLSNLTLSSASVLGGSSVTGTVTLIMAAPTGGSTVQLSTSSALSTTPASVTVAAGATSATFSVTTSPVSASTAVQVIATQGSTRVTAPLAIQPTALQSLAFSSTSVSTGASAIGTVTLTGPAPAGGTVVTLSSSDVSKFTCPASVTVASGSRTATFNATATSAGSGSSVITASAGGVSKTVTLSIVSISISSLSASPISAIGGTTFRMTVRISRAAPTGGLQVAVSVNNSIARLASPTVTVPAGATSVVVSVGTSRPTLNQVVLFTASAGGTSKSVQFTVTK